MRGLKVTAAVLAAVVSTVANAAEFTDVPADAWYAKSVGYVADNGLFDGMSQTDFAPESIMTRGMLVTAIGRLEGVPAEVGEMRFSDISADAVCAPYANWAAENSMVAGYDGVTFGPDDPLTREQMAVVFRNYFSYKHENVKVTKVMDYADYADVSDWAVEGVSFCTERGIIEGTDEHKFMPKSSLTRAEAAQVIYKIAVNGKGNQMIGKVTAVDHHGHITTDITIRDFVAYGFTTGDLIEISVGDVRIIAPYGTEYTDVDNDMPIILSRVDNEHISAAINMGSFSQTYGAEAGDEIGFAMHEKGGYEAELELRSSFIYTYDRNDYSSDAVFANFREITAGDIKPGRLYRSSTPINSVIGRSECAADLMFNAGIVTVINLTDTDMERIKQRDGYEGSYYSTVDINSFRTGLQMDSELFKTNMAKALKCVINAQQPILIHCQQGKDQTGLMAAMLAAVCGADYYEIVDDYMLSYENFYHIDHGTEQWQHLAEGNIVPSLLKMTGAASDAELKTIDLKAAVGEYMKKTLGLKDIEIDAIYDALCK